MANVHFCTLRPLVLASAADSKSCLDQLSNRSAEEPGLVPKVFQGIKGGKDTAATNQVLGHWNQDGMLRN